MRNNYGLNIKKKRKVSKVKVIILIIIFIVLFILLKNSFMQLISFFTNDTYIANIVSSFSKVDNEYETIKLDNNENYSGIGQQKISGKDGYFTTFTDISGKTYKEYKQNGSSSWSNKKYWDGNMSETGCGITAISIILSGYDMDYTPEDLRKKYFPVLDGSNISNELSKTFKLSNTDFFYDQVSLSKKNITEHLNKNKPVLICVWNKPKANRWTTASHYMVLLAYDNNNMVYLSNPNRFRQ